MENSNKKIAFNRKPVGEVTRGGGFSTLVKEAEAGTITVLYKFNEPVAIILPCDRTLEMAYEMSAGAGVFVTNAQNNNTPQGMMERFFRSLIESATLAKMMLGLDSANAIEQEVLNAFGGSSIKNALLDTNNDNPSAPQKRKQSKTKDISSQ